MKAIKITYWVSTSLVSLGMILSFFNYLFNPIMVAGYEHIGFPDWFRVELGIAKLLGGLALIIPAVPQRLKEWAYACFFVNFFSAFLAHYFVGDPVFNLVSPLVLLAILIISYITREKLINKPAISNP